MSTEKQKAKPPVFLGSDHGGLELKNHLKGYLEKQGYLVRDFGTHTPESVDYPDIAFLVGRAVAEARAAGLHAFGIMIDAVGVASAMVCNRVAGVRAAPGWCELSARSAREHNDAQVLTLGGRVVGRALAESIVTTFLESEYLGGRHQRRVAKIHSLTGETGRGPSGSMSP
jgi:ribose 5-phosphate isomerase B